MRLNIVLLIFVFALLSSRSFAEETKAAYDRHFDKAAKAFDAGNYDEAIDYFKKAIEDNPKIIDPYLNIAFSYLKSYQIPKAIETFENITKLFPEDSKAYYQLAYLYGMPETGEMAKSLKYYDEAKRLGIQGEDQLANLLAPFQSRDITVEYEPILDNPGKKKVIIPVKGNPVVDNTAILDTLTGLEKLRHVKGDGLFTEANIELIRLLHNQTVAVEKWTLKDAHGEKDYWVSFDTNPPPGFPSKIKIDLSETEPA